MSDVRDAVPEQMRSFRASPSGLVRPDQVLAATLLQLNVATPVSVARKEQAQAQHVFSMKASSMFDMHGDTAENESKTCLNVGTIFDTSPRNHVLPGRGTFCGVHFCCSNASSCRKICFSHSLCPYTAQRLDLEGLDCCRQMTRYCRPVQFVSSTSLLQDRKPYLMMSQRLGIGTSGVPWRRPISTQSFDIPLFPLSSLS